MRTSGYLNLGSKKLSTAIARTLLAIQKSRVDFDAIAVRGVSGLLVGPAVAVALNKHLIVVRKTHDTAMNGSSHSYNQVEGCCKKNCRYIIIDDFISTGETIGKVKEMVEDFNETAILVGVVLYKNSIYRKAWPEWLRTEVKVYQANRCATDVK